MIADTSQRLHELYTQGKNILLKARRCRAGIDHGTYPFVTSSNTTAGRRGHRRRVWPRRFDYVLGSARLIPRASAPAPSHRTARRHRPTKSPTPARNSAPPPAAPRRCGWFDAVALRRSGPDQQPQRFMHHQARRAGQTGKRQALRGYKINGKIMDTPPIDADLLAECQPSMKHIRAGNHRPRPHDYKPLPQKARDYLQRLEAVYRGADRHYLYRPGSQPDDHAQGPV